PFFYIRPVLYGENGARPRGNQSGEHQAAAKHRGWGELKEAALPASGRGSRPWLRRAFRLHDRVYFAIEELEPESGARAHFLGTLQHSFRPAHHRVAPRQGLLIGEAREKAGRALHDLLLGAEQSRHGRQQALTTSLQGLRRMTHFLQRRTRDEALKALKA